MVRHGDTDRLHDGRFHCIDVEVVAVKRCGYRTNNVRQVS